MVLYNALSTLQARYPNESITRSLSMFKVRGTVSGGTLASIYSMGELSPEERDTSEWAQVRKSTVSLGSKNSLRRTAPPVHHLTRLYCHAMDDHEDCTIGAPGRNRSPTR